MSFLTEWITSIILFILFAIVIDLLLPNSSMQKYAKMVVSLLLIVVMLNPIFALFRADPDQIFSEIMKGKDQAQSEEIKNQMNLEKKEIQASQRAYILKQMAVQLEKSAKEPLEKESYEMKHVEVLADEEHLDQNMEADQFRIKAVLVPLTGDAVETVAKVDIDLSRKKEESAETSAKEMARVKETLADVWNTRPEHIALNIEGGDAADHE
ncbi:stage III sporulation protein AF [Bacillus altitudinis]|uniref:stage III sporulation protein AF n=1 Tax=Bacillus TaxID=1386 RepID=UPI002E1C1CB4|nr:stage III sporulation protein AF [Bacillus altitudinis]MED4563342.1 stage III sporulation protein AF [Bacillus altitudinis]